ncbi:bifunctional (p)ppGpp synthetase/guanosine-3',5'-bis(diphosphate) 3'-pyrophosphohydrolase [Candidatus Gracilibacteria bacterium]|nr:bifunctional (p)ppGpp synthetase/guanosine-3',5'-bis(diphosphate) 3'-pyrophosphohydrolase [Candidatus Gracilibacteria bacterium]
MEKIEKYVIDLYDKLITEIEKYNKNYNKDFIYGAFLFAYNAHKNQYRKSKELYIIHPLNVAILLTKIEADDKTIIRALLHDVLDNKDIKPQDIEKNFGIKIKEIVLGVYKLGNLYYTIDMNSKDILNLKKELINIGDDIRIYLIKIVDRLHNLKTLDHLPKQKRYRIAKETKEIYIPIANFLSIGEFLHELNDLCFKYTQEDEYKKLDKIFGKNYEKHKKIIINTNNKIEQELQKQKIKIINIEGRVKSLYSIYKKTKAKNIDYKDIYDVLALRIITKNKQDIYKVLGILHNIYTAKNDRFKDYISSPKKNGYQAIHTTVIDENGEFLEFQIQSNQMMLLNKTGLAAHFIYKGFEGDFKSLPNWIKNGTKDTIDTKKFFENLGNEIIIGDIKCLDENKSIKLLPKDATLIDYAFLYSIENGKYFLKANINGEEILDPFFKLKSGDVIKLFKQKNIFTNYKIENFFNIKTSIAREEIKEIFKKYSTIKLVNLGKYTINTSLENLGYRHFENIPTKFRQNILKSFSFKDEEQMYFFIAIGSIETEKILNKVISIYTKDDKDKKVFIKINLKTIDDLSINNIIDTFFKLGISIEKIIYKKNKNTINISFNINNSSGLKDILKELKRLPNILNITRVFPFRLKIYYLFYTISLALIFCSVFFLNFFNVSSYEKGLILEIILFGSSIFMLGIAFLLKVIVKTILPDVLKYKRFWLSIFLLNTLIFFIIFWEILYLGFEFNYKFILYFLFCFIVYLSMFYEFLNIKKLSK